MPLGSPVLQSLSGIPFFGGLEPAALERLAASMRARRFRRGEVIFHIGDPGDALFVIVSGDVKISLPSETGDEAILATLRPGDVFGELALLDGAPRSASATAIGPTETVVLPRDRFRELLAMEAGFRDALLASIAGELRRLTHHVEELHFLDITGRLAARLVRLAEEGGTARPDGAIQLRANLTQADFMDNISLPGIKINVIMGRNAGFLTAASALARRHDLLLTGRGDESTDGPQLIYVPEVPFEMERFVADVEDWYRRKGRCHIAVSEGIADAEGTPIGATLIESAQVDAHGNVQLSGSGALGDQLADYLKERLTPVGGKPPRVRADTFGYVQRCWPDASPVDAAEARRAGQFAARLAMQGSQDGSVAIVRQGSGSELWLGEDNGQPYLSTFRRVELKDVAAKTRTMPPEFIAGHNNVSRAFIEYALPLVGILPGFERL